MVIQLCGEKNQNKNIYDKKQRLTWIYLIISRAKILKEIELYYLCQGQTEIIQMAEYFEEAEDFFLVFEKAEGGILLDHIQQRIR